jgi:hypothetical protein
MFEVVIAACAPATNANVSVNEIAAAATDRPMRIRVVACVRLTRASRR